jgi:hypothetical protein
LAKIIDQYMPVDYSFPVSGWRNNPRIIGEFDQIGGPDRRGDGDHDRAWKVATVCSPNISHMRSGSSLIGGSQNHRRKQYFTMLDFLMANGDGFLNICDNDFIHDLYHHRL